MLDFLVCDPVGRIDFLKMVNKYRIGEHERIACLHHSTGRKISIRTPDPAAVNYDGEFFSTDHAEFEVVPHAMRFVLPESVRKNETFSKAPKNSGIQSNK